jgi:hypothetical protein
VQGENGKYKFLVFTCQGKRFFGDLDIDWDDNIKMDLKVM